MVQSPYAAPAIAAAMTMRTINLMKPGINFHTIPNAMKNKTTAGLLALFLGGIGIHKFYLGKPLAVFIYLLFCWTYIPSLIALIEALNFFLMKETAFNKKYNK